MGLSGRSEFLHVSEVGRSGAPGPYLGGPFGVEGPFRFLHILEVGRSGALGPYLGGPAYDDLAWFLRSAFLGLE